MLMDLQIAANKDRFIELVNSIEREGFNKEQLLLKLENSDFFYAPASTKYHAHYKGGLCEHSLNVYDNLVKLNEMKAANLSEDSMKIVALFHDISKMNYYEVYFMNKKNYHAGGSKRDEGGTFDWEAVSAYKTRDASERFIFGSHEQTSEFMLRTFCPLTYEESIAILQHHGGLGFDSIKDSGIVFEIYDRYPIALMLHLADVLASNFDETRYE